MKRYKWGNEWIREDDHWIIRLSYRGMEVCDVLVDDADKAILEEHSWRLHPAGYPIATIKLPQTQGGKVKYHPIELHRFLRSAPRGMVQDHINRNKLDNRRANIRITTQGDNIYNSLRSDIAEIKRELYRNRPNPNRSPGEGCISLHTCGNRYEATLRGKYLGIRRTREECQQLIDAAKLNENK